MGFEPCYKQKIENFSETEITCRCCGSLSDTFDLTSPDIDYKIIYQEQGYLQVYIKDANSGKELAKYDVAKNMPMKVIQAQLRHSQISTSMNIYSHLMEHVNKSAMESMDSIFTKDLAKMRRPVYKKRILKDKKEKNVIQKN